MKVGHPVRLKLYCHSGPPPVSDLTIDFRLKTASAASSEAPVYSCQAPLLGNDRSGELPPNPKYIPVSSVS